jgi:hypothetical protein
VPYYCDPCRPIVKREQARRNGQKYREVNREEMRARVRAQYAANPARYREYQLKTRYGISLADYDEMLATQGGCALCGVTECQTGRVMPVDHDHTTGVVRGILCHRCNATLLPGYEALPEHLRDSCVINNYLARGLIERDPLLIGSD